jgi:TolB protein
MGMHKPIVLKMGRRTMKGLARYLMAILLVATLMVVIASAVEQRRITTDPADQYSPAISGNYIVWEDYRNGNSDIYLYDLRTGTERQITTDPEWQSKPAISGNYIVWADYRKGNSDIYLYDLRTGTERRITTDPGYQYNPAIDGNYIVCEDTRNGNLDIYLYDLKGKK